jgi:hypothetical protein
MKTKGASTAGGQNRRVGRKPERRGCPLRELSNLVDNAFANWERKQHTERTRRTA